MGLADKFKQFKFVHWVYNLLHYRSLLHNKAAYRKYNVHKSLIASISSKDFPDKESRAWLDVGDSRRLVFLKENFIDFPEDIQMQLTSWSENGYVLLKGFFSEATVESINKEMEKLLQQKKLHPTHDNKLMFANKISPVIRKI
ncbi:MAG: phytanoyl-CoA dioxygenase family protein, partial [Bacteroidota bacterium]